ARHANRYARPCCNLTGICVARGGPLPPGRLRLSAPPQWLKSGASAVELECEIGSARGGAGRSIECAQRLDLGENTGGPVRIAAVAYKQDRQRRRIRQGAGEVELMVRNGSLRPGEHLFRLIAPVVEERRLVVAGVACDGAGAGSAGKLAGAFAQCPPAE